MAKKPILQRPDYQPPEIRYTPIYEEMQRLRLNMIFHSQAYYGYDISFIDDLDFDKWAKRLVQMQADYPEWAERVPYADVFADWDGSTGFHLLKVDPEKFRTRIYHNITYRMEHEPNTVTVEMKAFVDGISRGII